MKGSSDNLTSAMREFWDFKGKYRDAVFRNRLKKEGGETVRRFNRLTLEAADGTRHVSIRCYGSFCVSGLC